MSRKKTWLRHPAKNITAAASITCLTGKERFATSDAARRATGIQCSIYSVACPVCKGWHNEYRR